MTNHPKAKGATIEECPHCGSTGGYYRRGKVSGGYVSYYNFDGSGGDNTHIHDSIRYKETKTAYCADCEQVIKHVTP